MKKLIFRRVLNLLLWLSACFLAATGFALKWRFPHGGGHRGGSGGPPVMLGLDKHEWVDLHTWVGVGFAVLILAHLYLAWPWLKNAAAGKKRLWAVFGGLATGLAMVAILLLAPVSSQTLAESSDSTLQTQGGSYGGNGPGDGTGNRWRQQSDDE
ncbi:DUF4405 domain-containing protein [Ruficoccus sp. ZRK36]|uniref:DUF4405 domain-containing protein n=1 Tax=Ruficoccus sp. ZRK36 TaxID=2866311 RepID=UPI001C72FE8F|nr:DUF4405 domain-containing protein [Ruficoccus sp. ZRK36]QYY35439.1 DUF4405 domain-containing protein [Ruficoccus sp. ZRK36]